MNDLTMGYLVQVGSMLLLLFIAIWFVRFFFTARSNRAKLRHFPIPKDTHWLWGNVNEFLKSPSSAMHYVAKQMTLLGEKFQLILGPVTLVIIADAESAKHLIVSNNTPKADYGPITKLVGEGLLTSNGEPWRHRRRLVNPGFHTDFMKTMTPDMVDIFEKLMSQLHKAASNGTPVNIHADLISITLDVIAKIGFNTDLTASTMSHAREILGVILEGINLIALQPFRWLTHPFQTHKYYQALKDFRQISLNIIAQENKSIDSEAKHAHPKSILSLLLQNQRSADAADQWTEEQLCDEISTFLLAGHETTASTLSFTLLVLARHPEIKRQVIEEAREVMGHRKRLDYDDQFKVPYIANVIREVLRLYPIGPGTIRSPEKDVTLPDGTILPAGSVAYIHFFCIHRNPRYWKDPNVFRPERFENLDAEREQCTYMPFSAGPRNCIGRPLGELETRLLLTTMAAQFDWEVVEADVDPEDFIFAVTVRPPLFHLKFKAHEC